MYSLKIRQVTQLSAMFTSVLCSLQECSRIGPQAQLYLIHSSLFKQRDCCIVAFKSKVARNENLIQTGKVELEGLKRRTFLRGCCFNNSEALTQLRQDLVKIKTALSNFDSFLQPCKLKFLFWVLAWHRMLKYSQTATQEIRRRLRLFSSFLSGKFCICLGNVTVN